MGTNPSPARITDELWYFWLQLQAMEPTSQLGGIYANKSGYHNTRDANNAQWPGNYSVVLAPDKEGPSDKSSALDWTFPEAHNGGYASIIKYADRLLRSGMDLNDERGNVLREFYGQADWDLAVEGWDFYYVRAATSDASHLWHIHFSFLRKWCNSKWAMDAVLSILRGETVQQWRAANGTQPPPPPQPALRRPWPSWMGTGHYFGDYRGNYYSHGGYVLRDRAEIKAIQQRLIVLGFVPGVTNVYSGWADEWFGPATISAVSSWQRALYAQYTTKYGQVWQDDWGRLFTF